MKLLTFDNFESIADFKFNLVTRGEILFTWNGAKYGAFRDDDEENGGYKYFFFEVPHDEDGIYFATPDELLNHIVQGKKLREIITEVSIVFM